MLLYVERKDEAIPITKQKRKAHETYPGNLHLLCLSCT